MVKKILVLSVAVVVAIVLSGLAVKTSLESNITESEIRADQRTVSITVSSSRPGCEKSHACYVPEEITIGFGESLTWINDDSAFHTVTSGYYDVHDGSFDSGQLDPAQRFSHTFDETGSFHYYCKLHPWMEGIVVVN